MRAVLTLAFLLGGCAPSDPDARLSGPSTQDLLRLWATAAPQSIVAADQAGIAAASAAAEAASTTRISALPRSRRIEISALPWLRASPEGAMFLASGLPRALARGAPAESCPAAAASLSLPAPSTRSDAAASALGACLDQLARRGAAETCGCRLVAADEALLAPLSEFGYAPVVSALVIGAGPPRRLVAEALHPVGRAELVILRDALDEVAHLVLLDEEAELVFTAAPDIHYVGVREPFGYRRGRLAERLRLKSPDGEDLTVLLGVEARDAER
ncbi:MAG: hypothetical protein WD969_00750 [Paracoccaceae bacterium]